MMTVFKGGNGTCVRNGICVQEWNMLKEWHLYKGMDGMEWNGMCIRRQWIGICDNANGMECLKV